jgi:hypothetical protein
VARAKAELSKHCTANYAHAGGIEFPNCWELEPARRTFGWCRGHGMHGIATGAISGGSVAPRVTHDSMCVTILSNSGPE